MRLLTAPTTPVLSLASAKAWLRVEHDLEDELIAELIAGIVSHLDGWTGILGRALEAQTWELSLDAFPAREIRLPLGPVESIAGVSYLDPEGDEQTLAADRYVLDAAGVEGWLIPVEGWPATMAAANAVSVRWVAGLGCPPAVRDAVRAWVAYRYHNREAAGMPPGVDAALATWRRTGL